MKQSEPIGAILGATFAAGLAAGALAGPLIAIQYLAGGGLAFRGALRVAAETRA